MTILHISDTHGQHKKLTNLPSADVIVHSGDFTFGGSEQEAVDFMQWFYALPYKHKVFIAGNHDMCMYGDKKIEGLPDNVHYLCNSSVMIDDVKFYGMPMFMEDVMDRTYDKLITAIPDDADVLVTHQPPYGILDGGEYHGKQNFHYGSYRLYAKVLDVKPKLHLFGHDHNVYGREKHLGITFSNAAIVNSQYILKKEIPLIYNII